MRLDALRLHAASMAIGLIALVVYVAAGGRLGPSDQGTILIEYGAYPAAFEGLEVAIDGESAGVLKSHGAQTRTAFAVKPGSHRIMVMGARFASRPRQVEVKSGATVALLLDIGETIGPVTQGKTPIALN